jgi:phosphoribosylformylglycinamidine cyclo-ligase
MKKQKITYSQSGVNYEALDPIKKLAQTAALETADNLVKNGFQEVAVTRGESAYVWQQGDTYMASVIEGLGTKNMVADGMQQVTGKSYYETIGHDTVASIINDLISVGAKPLVIHAYWAVGDSKWLEDAERMKDLITGWKRACDLSGASWGGGETPTLSGIIEPETIDLGGNAIGIIQDKNHLITEKKLVEGDRILLLKSTGINVNGISLARALAKKLPEGYAAKLPNGELFGEAVLKKTNIYAKLIQDLQNVGIDIHYASNITGHGMRKLMRATRNFSYIIEKIFEPQELFTFIQEHAGLSDYEIYETYNMGQDYALFLPESDVAKAQAIVRKNGFESLDAGYVEKGPRQVIIKPKDITYSSETLNLR